MCLSIIKWLNTGLDFTGKSNVGKPPDRKSQGKPGTNESETNDEDKLNEEIETANSDFETNNGKPNVGKPPDTNLKENQEPMNQKLKM